MSNRLNEKSALKSCLVWFVSDLLRPLSDREKICKRLDVICRHSIAEPVHMIREIQSESDSELLDYSTDHVNGHNVICFIRKQQIFDDKSDEHTWISTQDI